MIALTGLMAFSSIVVMAQEEQQKPEVLDTLQNVRLAKTDSAADYREFTDSAEMQINRIQETIVNLKEKEEQPSEAATEGFKEKVLALEQENEKMKKRLADAEKVKTISWTVFKYNFNRDMEELERAIRDIA